MANQTHSRRFFLSLTVAFAAAAVSASAAVDPALAALIPADATIVSGVNVTQAKTSSFGRFVLSQMNVDDAGAQSFIAETGFDPRRDLNDVMVATVGNSDKPSAIVLGRGVFSPSRIFDTAKAHGATVTSYRGVDIATHNDGAIAFVDASIAIAGTDKLVRAALDQRAMNSAKLPDAVLQKMRELSAANDVWFYSTVSPADFFVGKMADPNVGGPMKDGLLQSVLQAAGGIKFSDKEARVNGEATTRSDKDATALADVFRFLAQIVQSNGQNQRASEFAALLGKLELSTSANVMKVSMSIPEDLLERVFAKRGARVARVR